MRLDLHLCVLFLGAGVLTACDGGSNVPGTGQNAPATVARCVSGPGTTVVYQAGGVVEFWAAGGRVFVGASDAILSIPLAGGAVSTLAHPDSLPGVVAVLGDYVYFVAEHAVGSIDDAGKQQSAPSLYRVPILGGDPTMVLADTYAMEPFATDATSIYFIAPGMMPTKLTPPSTLMALPLDGKVIVDAIAVHGDYLYVATQDLTSKDPANGGIQRVPTAGGPAERIVSGIGHPWLLVADASGLFWSEDPPTGTYGNGHLAHAALDGSGVGTLLDHGARGLALLGDDLYFAWDVVGRVPKAGGTPVVIDDKVVAPGSLTISGGNLVWVDPVDQALSDPTLPKILTACAAGSGT